MAVPLLPQRDPEGHKGTFGTVAVLAGSCSGDVRMAGAGALAAAGALRAGAGLVRLVMPGSVLNIAMSIVPSATGIVLPTEPSGEPIAHDGARVLDDVLDACDCLAIGPGLGISPGAESLCLRALGQDDVPVVADADAINNLARVPDITLDVRAPAIFTPHPGEFRRLAAALSLKEDPAGDASARHAACEALARRLGAVVVLKGAHTAVSDGQRTWVGDIACAALATAGTGDVLTGLIAGLVAQFVRIKAHPMLPDDASRPLDLYDAACIAARAHALAGVRWCECSGASAGLMAVELADLLPSVLEAMRAAPPA